MRPLLLVALLPACAGAKGECGPGTHLEDGTCVVDEVDDTAEDTSGDTDTAEHSDTSGDSHTSGDTDTDTSAETDTSKDTDSASDTDADRDGFGPDEGDCDDEDASVNPDAAEVCGNGVDDDCDGLPDGCAWSGEHRLPAGAVELAGERTGDQAGASLAVGSDVDGDGVGDVILGASWASRSGAQSGSVYLVRGPVRSDVALGGAEAVLYGDGAGAFLGVAVGALGDMDGDGYGDLIAGQPHQYAISEPTSTGAAWIVHGPVTGSGSIADAGVEWRGESTTGAAGTDVAGVGDVTGDGLPDALVGAWYEASYMSRGGAAYVIEGPAATGGTLDDAAVRIYGDYGGRSSEREYLGSSVTGLGDVNGDGVADIGVGAWGHSEADGNGYYVGAVYVYLGPLSAHLLSTDADATVVGTNHGDTVGGVVHGLSGAGDTDGDGLADLLLGGPTLSVDGHTGAGTAWLVGGAALDGRVDLFFADWTLEGAQNDGLVGTSVCVAGDEDGDGFGDVLVGAPGIHDYGLNAGGAWLFRGPLGGTSDLGDAGAVFYGDGADWLAGASVAGGADVTGDDWADLLVGATTHDGGASVSGSAYVLAGGGF